MTITAQPYTDTYEKDCFHIIEKVVIDGFIESGVDIQKNPSHLSNELKLQRDRLLSFPNKYFIAIQNYRAIGMIAHLNPCNAVEIVANNQNIPIIDIQEIVAVYVHPDFQRIGIGSKLFTHMGSVLKAQHIPYFALSTGYKRGKQFWTKKLGEESEILPTYYEGHPCHVWIRDVDDIL